MDLQLAAEIASRVSNVLFIVLGVVAFRLWHRHRDEAAKWLAIAFGTLAVVIAISLAGGDALPRPLATLVLVGILAFPPLMLQFTAAFEPLTTAERLVPLAVGAGLVGWAVAVVPLPEDVGDRTSTDTAFVLSLLVYFAALSLTVAWRMWRGGREQPTLARRRMRTLAIATLLLSLALLLAGSGVDAAGLRLLVQLVAMGSTLLFAVAFVPPPFLRSSWRAREESELYGASLELLGTATAHEVGEVLLPHVARVIGARGAALCLLDGTVLAEHGTPDGPQQIEIELSRSLLHVWVSPYTPFFGEEELRLLRRLGLLADLSIERAELLGREQDARRQIESVNAELEAFVYSASHDLKTPLLSILGFLEVIDTEPEGLAAPDAPFYLERMRANARYMQSLIGDLLELSRIGRAETSTEDVELEEVVEEVAEDVGGRYPEVAVVVAGPLPTIRANRTRVRQLMTNLVENAARYGGRPDIHVTISARPDGTDCELRVADDGIGIPPEHHERLFGVFERLATDQGGTGIGLAICRKIVAELGGRIRFVPTDAGADVRITVPDTVVVALRVDRRAG